MSDERNIYEQQWEPSPYAPNGEIQLEPVQANETDDTRTTYALAHDTGSDIVVLAHFAYKGVIQCSLTKKEFDQYNYYVVGLPNIDGSWEWKYFERQRSQLGNPPLILLTAVGHLEIFDLLQIRRTDSRNLKNEVLFVVPPSMTPPPISAR